MTVTTGSVLTLPRIPRVTINNLPVRSVGGSPSAAVLIWNQDEPVSTWVIPHSFARRPAVDIYIDAELVEADVTASATQVSISFPSPHAGQAVLT